MTGVKAIADALSVNSSMTSLNLANNDLGLALAAGGQLTKGARVIVDGKDGVISYGPDSDEEYKVKFDSGSESGYLKADKLKVRDMTGIKAIADALNVSTSLTSLK